MKRIISLAMAFSLLFSLNSCFGEFALVRKVYKWNDSVVNNDLAKTLLFYGLNIIPVYSIAGSIDYFILNLIEFWSGSNPLAMAPGEVEKDTMNIDGEDYTVYASYNRFDIEDANGNKITSLSFCPESNTWSKIDEQEETPLVQYISIDGSSEALVFQNGEAVASFDLDQYYSKSDVSAKLKEATLSTCD